MARKPLTVKRKAYSYKRNGKTVKVPATTFKIKDRGKVGRGKKVFPDLKKGTLGISFDNKASTRRKKLASVAKKKGEKVVVGKLRALQILNKNTNPSVSRKAKADSKWVAGSFKGKKRMKYPTGLSKR